MTVGTTHEEIMKRYEEAKEKRAEDERIYDMLKSSLNRRKEKLEAQMRDKEKNT